MSPQKITFVCIKEDRDNPVTPEQIFILSIRAEVRQNFRKLILRSAIYCPTLAPGTFHVLMSLRLWPALSLGQEFHCLI